MEDLTKAGNVTAAPELPGPVQIPEYYTGFGKEFETVASDLQAAYERMQKAEQELAKPPIETSKWLQRLALFFPPANLIQSITAARVGAMSPEQVAASKAEASAEFDAAMKAFQIAEWKTEIMQVMPGYMSDPSYPLESAEDMLQYVAPGTDLSAADRAWLNQLYQNLLPLSNVLPEDYQGDVLDAQSKILNEILTEPKVDLAGVHSLTIEEIAKAFVFGVAELPAGMTEEDVRNLLSQMDLQNEELLAQREWLEERAKEWEIESARMGMIQAGQLLAETPELTPLEWAKLTVTQPMMATVELMQKWWDKISRPISAAIMIHMPAPAAGATHGVALGAAAGATIGSIIPGLGTAIGAGIGALVGAITGAGLFTRWEDEASVELTEIYEFYKTQGESSWSAYAKAFNEWDAPWWRKMALDSAYDPLMWLGWGGITAVGRKLTTVALPRGLKWAGTRIGNLMVAFEQGYVTGMDLVFKGAMEVVAAPIKSAFWLTGAGYTIPKTFTQMARNFARKGLMDFKAVLDRAFPQVRNLRGLTSADVTKMVEDCIQAAVKRPMEGNDLMVRAGANLLEFSYLDEVAVSKMITSIVGDIGLDSARLARFNSMIIDSFSGQGNRITAGKILSELGVVATDDMVSKMAQAITKFKDGVVRSATKAYTGNTADEVLMSIFNKLEKTRYGNLHSPLTQYMQQAGRSASWHSRVADRVLYSAGLVAMERRLVMPVARWQLLFMNFGPYNFLENSMRSALGGAEAMYPKAYGGVAETNRLFRGIPNAPYELQMFERGEVRLTQAVINPQTGTPVLLKGGRVPFVTKDVVIPEKIPFFGGKKVGRLLNIGTDRYYLGSFQDWYDMWAELVAKQNAYDYQVHWLKALKEIDPATMASVDEIFEVTARRMLNDIPSIPKRDIPDIIRTMKNEALSSGPEGLRTMADIDVMDYQLRQISKDLNMRWDQMTDVHAYTKKGVNNEVLDGTMFKKGTDSVDDRINAWIATEREMNIASLSPQMEVLKEEVDAFVANPPRNLDDFLGDMQNITSHIDAVGERIHDFRRLTELRKAKLNPGEVDAFEIGSAKMLAQYMDVSEESLTKMMNQLMENGRAIPKFTDAYRLGPVKPTTGFTATEGTGLYVSKTYDLAASFRGTEAGYKNVRTVRMLEPKNPLVADNLLVLNESDELFKPILATDSQWTKIQKQAAQNVGITDTTWSAKLPALNDEISRLAREAGYDAIDAGEWYVLLNENLWKNLPAKGVPILSEAQLARLSDLDSITRLRMENILATRNKIAEIESAIPKTPRSARTDRFWSQQRAMKSTVWDEWDTVNRRLTRMELAARRNFLQSVDKPVFVPDFVPEVTGDLTINHVAYLYGVTGDDVYRGLTRIQRHTTVRPREDFIVHTQEQANAYAAKFGKTADQIGFTEEAIGQVYDDLWRNLGVNPNILTPDSPTVMQMEEIRQELYRLYHSTKIPEADVVKWRQTLNRVADDVANLDIYQTARVSLRPEGVPGVARGEGTYDIFIEGKAVRGAVVTEAMPEADSLLVKELVFDQKSLATAGNIDGVLDEINRLAQSRGFKYIDIDVLGKKTYEKLAESRGFTRFVGDYPGYTGANIFRKEVTAVPSVYGNAAWWTTKEQAMTRAREMHALAYPTYDDANIIDETMRAIFPFWNYELFRWRWLPRTFLRTPGVMSGLARYMHYSDQGYMPVPGTDLQLNPLRGTVFMGGLRSMYLRDFPEFHDSIPGIEFLDYIGRAGFFPGVHVMLPVVGLSSIASGQPMQWAELAPAWVKTSLSGLRALSPQHIGAVLDVIYPDRFRDYMTMMQLASMGYDGDEIWRKKQEGAKLTPEEEKLWLQAVNKVDGIKGVLMNQTGLFRIRPQEFTQIRQEMQLAIEEATGVPVSTQEWIDKMYPVTGKRFTDYYHLDIQQQALLYQWESYRRYQGITEPLYPSSWRALDIKTADYYAELERIYEDARYNGIYEDGVLKQQSMTEINRQLIEGIIGPDQWRSARSSMQESLAAAVDALSNSPAYKDVPKTFEERAKLLEERGIVTPTQSPDQELLYYYYELEPELKYNWESDRMELDFDTYYAYIDILLESLSPTHRERLLERIQNDWTPMEKLYWQFSRDFARPYRNLREVVMNEYTDEQRQLIRRYEVARGEERTELQNVMGPDGKLISGYQSRLREARQRLRILDPTLDAWLYFFGTTDKFMSHESEEIYNNLTKQYLVPAMAGTVK